MIGLMIGLLLAAQVVEAPAKTSVGMLLLFDGSAVSQEAQKDCKTLVGEGFVINFADAGKPENAAQVKRFGVTSDKLPYYAIYRGHECIEVSWGGKSVKGLRDWLRRAVSGKSSLGMYGTERSVSQEFLKPVDKSYLQYKMTPGSCGMLGCQMHGGGMVLERVYPK